MDSQTRLNRRILFATVFPFVVVLLLINALAWWIVLSSYVPALTDVTTNAASSLDARIFMQVAQLRSIGKDPAVDSSLMLARRDRVGVEWSEQVKATARAWPKLGNSHARVREVLDNGVVDILKKVVDESTMIDSIVLTDSAGVVLAATEKPLGYNFSEILWWQRAQSSDNAAAISEGFVTPGTLGIAVILRDSEKGIVKGVLNADLNVPQLTAGLGGELSRGIGLALVGSAVELVADEGGTIGILDEPLAARIKRRPSGWYKGVRFRGEILDGGIAWEEPVGVVVLQREGYRPFILAASLLVLGLVSLLLAVGWDRYIRRLYQGAVVNPQREMLEAGDWILRTALNRNSSLPGATGGGSSKTSPEVTPLQKDLQKWLHRLLQDLQDEYAAQTYEMQRDLSLARDFQQAYIDRAYPKVPAVHVEGRLRLEFYHRYEPALALGGDFYNILTLGPDSAGVFVSDVMGHGTRSALITAIIRTLIDDLAPQARNARHFLTEMNRQFCALLTSVPNPLFASACYFVADTTARVVTYSSAGHPAPFHVRRSVGRINRLEVPMPRGAALGMIPDEQYTGGYARLIDGDLFLFFTDGVYEAHNIHGEEFGIARMEEVLRRDMYKNAQEIVNGMMEAITNFVTYEPIMDDICIVAVEVTSKAAL